MSQFRVNDGKVEMLDSSGAVTWAGLIKGLPAVVVLPIAGTADCIVLLDPDAQLTGSFNNLLRVSSSGSIVWEAPLPGRESDDSYVAVEWSEGKLMANSWSCFRIHLDKESGRILSAEFTK